MSYATAPDGTQLFYERFTPPAPAKPLPIVLIAGWAANGRLWRPAVERGLAAGYEVITLDSRGTGRSTVPLAWQAVGEMLADPASPRGSLFALLAAARHSTWSRLPSLRTPTQVQHGTADPLIRTRAAVTLAAAIPHAELRLVQGAGHALILERPDETMAAGLSFLGRVNPPPTPRPEARAPTPATACS